MAEKWKAAKRRAVKRKEVKRKLAFAKSSTTSQNGGSDQQQFEVRAWENMFMDPRAPPSIPKQKIPVQTAPGGGEQSLSNIVRGSDQHSISAAKSLVMVYDHPDSQGSQYVSPFHPGENVNRHCNLKLERSTLEGHVYIAQVQTLTRAHPELFVVAGPSKVASQVLMEAVTEIERHVNNNTVPESGEGFGADFAEEYERAGQVLVKAVMEAARHAQKRKGASNRQLPEIEKLSLMDFEGTVLNDGRE
jgi:hypothetical protein